MNSFDTLVRARWVIPGEPAGAVLEHHTVALSGGEIVDVFPTDGVSRPASQEIVELPAHAVIPGLVNAHTHAAMNLFRGMSDDLPLMEWLQGHIWPAEARFMSPEFVRDGTALAVAEMLRGGTTCFNDMYYFSGEVARAAEEAGIRAVVGLIVLDFPTAWAKNADEYLEKGVELHEALRGSGLVTAAFAPHAPYTVSDGPLEKVRDLAGELDLRVHIHVHETPGEVSEAEAAAGMRPLARLEKLGLLGPRLLAVHMTQLLDEEIERLAATGVHVLHSPESNLKLASGFCPVEKLRQAGINVALGTDSAASNNDLDMLGETRTAALLAKGGSGSAAALPAPEALQMATLNGARALGLQDRIGSLRAGKAADLVAVDLSAASNQPVYDPISQVVYAATRDQVTDVWVAGRRVLHDRRLTTLNEPDILRRAAGWRDTIAGQQAEGG